MRKYYLATAFDKVYMQPIGSLAINGISAEVPFFKSLLTKVGIEMDFVRIGKYKDFPDSLTRDSMSNKSREALTAIVKDLSLQVIKDISKGRKIKVSDLTSFIDKGLFTDKDSVKLGLIDDLKYKIDIVPNNAIKLDDYIRVAGKEDTFISRFRKKEKALDKVAFVVAEGKIATGGKGNITAKSLSKTFDKIIEDKDIKAVILRINSPGGSAIISETIYNYIVRLKKEGKKVIVSMSGVTASGGYWIASAADKIVANPATFTGSIGVFGGKPVLKSLWKKIGVSWNAVSYGESSGMWSHNKKFSKLERQRIILLMENIYQNFIDRVAEGRSLSKEKVEKIAQGRVWTGSQAKEHNLVDELGGIYKAIDITKEQLNLSLEDKILIEKYPLEKTGLEKILDILENEAVTFSSIINSDFINIIKSPDFLNYKNIVALQ